MNLYIYSILIPLIIILVYWVLSNNKPVGFLNVVKYSINIFFHLVGYMFFLYYLNSEKNINIGGADLALFIFLIPIAILLFSTFAILVIINKLKK